MDRVAVSQIAGDIFVNPAVDRPSLSRRGQNLSNGTTELKCANCRHATLSTSETLSSLGSLSPHSLNRLMSSYASAGSTGSLPLP